MSKKLVIPTKQEKRIAALESENKTLQHENTLLKAQNEALTERTDFHEELIAEMAMLVYA